MYWCLHGGWCWLICVTWPSTSIQSKIYHQLMDEILMMWSSDFSCRSQSGKCLTYPVEYLHIYLLKCHTRLWDVYPNACREAKLSWFTNVSSEKGKPEAQLNPWWRAAACCVLLWRSVEDLVLNSRVWNVFGCCFSEVQELSKFHYQMCWDVLLIVPITLF